MKTEPEIKAALKAWIAGASKKLQASDITDETPIIEQRIITSLQVMDLILYIEQLSGQRVEVENLKPGAFRDINAIYASFFGGKA